MSPRTSYWAGRLYGTNTGNLAAELHEEDGSVSGTLRLLDTDYGVAVFEVSGTFQEGRLSVDASPTQTSPDVQYGFIKAEATLLPNGDLSGSWVSTLGTGGAFQLFPHRGTNPVAPVERGSAPEQLHTSTLTLGAVRLSGGDLNAISRLLGREFSTGRIVVTYDENGTRVSRYYDEFASTETDCGELRFLKLVIQEPEAHGINRVIAVELDASARNTVTVQGIHQAWVIGIAETLARAFKNHERSLVTTYKRYGLGLNQVMFLIIMVLLPEIDGIWRRALFVGIGLSLLTVLYTIHSHMIPSASIHFGASKGSWLSRIWPTVGSWLLAATAALAAMIAFYFLT